MLTWENPAKCLLLARAPPGSFGRPCEIEVPPQLIAMSGNKIASAASAPTTLIEDLIKVVRMNNDLRKSYHEVGGTPQALQQVLSWLPLTIDMLQQFKDEAQVGPLRLSRGGNQADHSRLRIKDESAACNILRPVSANWWVSNVEAPIDF